MGAWKSIRTEPLNHARRGDERIRTAVPAPGADLAYERRAAIALEVRDAMRAHRAGKPIAFQPRRRWAVS